MGSDELHEHAAERKGNVNDQPVLVAAEIEDDAIVAHEIDGTAELPIYLGRTLPLCSGGNREPCPDRPLRMRVTCPEFLQCPTGDHLHRENISCHQFGDNPQRQGGAAKEAARLLIANGRLIAVRRYGGTSPEALAQEPMLSFAADRSAGSDASCAAP